MEADCDWATYVWGFDDCCWGHTWFATLKSTLVTHYIRFFLLDRAIYQVFVNISKITLSFFENKQQRAFKVCI